MRRMVLSVAYWWDSAVIEVNHRWSDFLWRLYLKTLSPVKVWNTDRHLAGVAHDLLKVFQESARDTYVYYSDEINNLAMEGRHDEWSEKARKEEQYVFGEVLWALDYIHNGRTAPNHLLHEAYGKSSLVTTGSGDTYVGISAEGVNEEARARLEEWEEHAEKRARNGLRLLVEIYPRLWD